MFKVSNTLQSFIGDITDEIKSKAPISSGSLRSSIKSNINALDEGITISFSMLDYGYYQDKGVNGTKRSWGSPFSFSKMPPTSALDGWVVKKGIAPRNNKGQFTTRKGLNFVIARSIMENGIRPKNFIEPVINNNIDRLSQIIIDDIFDEFEKNIKLKD